MPEFLQRILAAKKVELARRMASRPAERMLDGELPPLRDLGAALTVPGLSVIAEIKRRSPSAGWLRPSLDPALLAGGYEASGARAISVLTDREFFGGSDRDLLLARQASALPVLRKDFLLDPYQVRESRVLGADAILLIVRILGATQLSELLDAAREHGLAALVEIHDDDDLRRATDVGADLIGVNSRDLDTFATDLNRAVDLRRSIPAGITVVAESGIRTRDDLLRMQRAGFDAVLVGERLMRGDDPARALDSLLETAR